MEPKPARRVEKHGSRYRVRRRVAGRWVIRSFISLDEAEQHVAMLDLEEREAAAVDAVRASGALTIMEIVRLWWLGPVVNGEHRGGHRVRVAGVTQRNYQYYIDAYISRIGDESAQSYARNPGLLKLFYDSLPNRCAWHVHGVLRMVFRDAVTRGLVDRNPCMDVKPAPRKRRRRYVPSRAEVEKIVAAAEEQDPRWGLFVYLTSVLGTRCGETVALRAEDFDETRGFVHIERAATKTAGGPTLKEPKKGEPRALPIDDPDFWAHVRPFLSAGGFLFQGFHRDARRGGTEKPWHPDHAQGRFKTMVRSLGLPPYTLHSLRHYVATQLLIEGQPINQVAEFLGHSPQMTLTLYGRHLDHEAMRRVGRAATTLVRRPAVPARVTTGDDASRRDTVGSTSRRAPVVPREMAENAILDLARGGPVTNALVRTRTGLTRRQTAAALDRLVSAGKLARVGSRRGTTYTSVVTRTA